MGHCTVPSWLGFRAWFEARFDKYCLVHDNAYKATRNVFKKLWADFVFCGLIGRDVLLGLVCFMGAVAILPTLGTVYWAYHRICEWRRDGR